MKPHHAFHARPRPGGRSDPPQHLGHRVAVALVAALALFTLSQAWGQPAQGAGAMFEGRPAMSGAQGGQGAQAGMPQGGLGTQGSEGQRGLDLRKPSGLDAMPAVPGKVLPQGPVPSNAGEVAPRKDSGVAKEQRSAVKKATRAAKRTVRRARTGVGEIDTAGKPGN